MRRPLLLLVFAVALTLRLVNAIWLPGQGGDLVVSDMKGYDRAAVALLEQQPLAVHTIERYLLHPLGSDTYHPPLYYYFLALIYAVFGHSFLAVRVVQALLGAVTCLLVYSIGHEAFGDAAALLAAAFAALYPPFIFYTGVLLTETLSTFLLASATWLVLRAGRQKQNSYLYLGISGLLLGLAGLTRSVLLIALAVAVPWLAFVSNGRLRGKQAAQIALALGLPALLAIAPITVRNYQIHRAFVLISTNGGVNFFLGHGGSPAWKNQIRHIPADYNGDEPLIGISDLTATEEESYFYRLGWQYIGEHPLRTLLDLPQKLRAMYWDSDYWPASDAQAHVMRTLDLVLWRLLLLPLFLVGGLIVRLRRQRQALLLFALALSSVAVPVVFWAQTRFRVPFVPFFVILAAGTVCELHLSMRRRFCARTA
jgi:4-amino-4-deoxy-L-arabinose transferase-like glycosyltransferase